MPRVNLRNKLLLFSVVIAIIPLLIAGQSLIRIARDEMKSSANDQLVTTARQVTDEYAKGGIRLGFRTHPEVVRFFDGLELVDPGVVTATEWFRAAPPPAPEGSGIYAGVARIP